MTNGLSAILAITLAGSVVTSQLKVFDTAVAQVSKIDQLMTAAIDHADTISPGTKVLAD